ncbi:MAG: enoyl-CoA hydratase/isomerase family protein [Rhodocyclaceae bacterium]|nr:enoyl-CoA hydratase/isomerase family protein [Rhodocyclaceae bacterium]MBX3667247.1 enoyl-CoA hydratase/isomerase family protein [Rhodocyclaceae bacterium]
MQSVSQQQPAVPGRYEHWQLQRDADGIAWARLDRAHEANNVLTRAVMAELGQLLDELETAAPRGLVITSAKASGFIAGADIDEFGTLSSLAEVRALVERGWNLYNRLAALPYPTLALVSGYCLGGGLELALACRYLIAVDAPDTQFALPEVMLGIVPGWGGMLRLPQRVGAPAALDLLLTGRSVDAYKARALGLADACVPARLADATARDWLVRLPPRRELPWLQRVLSGPLAGIVRKRARAQVAARARPEHYPAPYAILDMWAHYGGNALAVPDTAPGSLAAIFKSHTSRNLVRVFKLRERLKTLGKAADFSARHVHVIGAGSMGGDIAAWCAGRGLDVTLQDQDLSRIATAIARAAAAFKRRYRRDARTARLTLDRIVPDPQGLGISQADVVIEAIFENLDAKHALMRELEPRLKPGALLATNTSSLALEQIAGALQRPERLVGIHFFNPVARMPLVEVVSGAATPAEEATKAAAFVRAIDKLPLPVKSAPGFLVNAVLGPYMLEAMRCVDEGLSAASVDAAALGFGMPMGPLELADTVGLDIALAAGKQLAAGASAPRCLSELVAAGRIGKKSGAGFYAWNAGKPAKTRPGPVPAGLADRLIAPLLAATKNLVEAGIVADADLADAGVIFGTGFAPYTGGPMNYLAQHEG